MTGKRVFRMAPLQHHFELLGWARGHHRHPVLDHRRAVRRPRARALLRRVGGRAWREPARLDGADPAATPTGPGCASWSPGIGRQRLRRGRRPARARRAVVVVDGARRRPAPARAGPDPRHPRRATCGSAPSTPIAGLPRRRRPTSSSPRPGWRPDQPAAGRRPRAAGVPVWGEVELAWRMRAGRRRRALADRHRHQRQDHHRRDARRDAARRRAAGRGGRQRRHARARGRAAPRARTTCSPSSCPASSCTGRPRSRRRPRACLNVAPDHLDWHGSLEAYRAAKGQVYAEHRGRLRLQRRRPGHRAAGAWTPTCVEGCRAIGFTLGTPGAVDARGGRRRARRPGLRRAARAPRRPSWPRSTTCAAAPPTPGPAHTSPTPSPPPPWPGPTASRRVAVRDGLRGFAPTAHRIADGRRASTGVRYVDDSKATNPHAAAASLRGLRARRLGRRRACSRAPTVDDLVARRTPTGCAASCCIGGTAAGIARGARATRARCPRRRRGRARTLASMDRRRRARGRRSRGPATSCCSRRPRPPWTMFRDYAARGDAFAAAVRRARAGPPDGLERVSAPDLGPADRPRRGRPPGRRRAPAQARSGWPGCDSPLTTYYAAARRDRCCCVVIGLVMVLSASSVDVATRRPARSFTVFNEPAACSPSIGVRRRCSSRRRLPVRVWQRLRLAAACCSRIVLQVPGLQPARASTVNGNRNWIALGRSRAAAVRGRQDRARRLGGRPCSRRKRTLLDQLRRTSSCRSSCRSARSCVGLVLAGRDLGTGAGPAARSSAALLFAAGAPAADLRRAAARWPALAVVLRRRPSANRMARFDVWLGTATADPHGTGCQPLHGTLRPRRRRLVGRRPRRQPGEVVAGCPRRTTTSSSRSSARSSACSARSSCSACSRVLALGLLPARRCAATTSFVRIATAGVMAWIARPGADQHRRRHRPAAGHRRAAAAGVVAAARRCSPRCSRSACCCPSPASEPGLRRGARRPTRRVVRRSLARARPRRVGRAGR